MTIRYCVYDGFQFVFANDKPQQCPDCQNWFKLPEKHDGITLVGPSDLRTNPTV